MTRNRNDGLRAEIRKALFSYSDSSASEPSSDDEDSAKGKCPPFQTFLCLVLIMSVQCSKHGLDSDCSCTPAAIAINTGSQDLADVLRAEFALEIEALDNMLREQAEAHEAEINHLMEENAALQERLAIPGRHQSLAESQLHEVERLLIETRSLRLENVIMRTLIGVSPAARRTSFLTPVEEGHLEAETSEAVSEQVAWQKLFRNKTDESERLRLEMNIERSGLKAREWNLARQELASRQRCCRITLDGWRMAAEGTLMISKCVCMQDALHHSQFIAARLVAALTSTRSSLCRVVAGEVS